VGRYEYGEWPSKFVLVCFSEQLRKAAHTLKRFPTTSDDALEDRFPLITAGEVKRFDKSLSHGRNDHLDAVHVNIKPLYQNKK
jgi:hypothetical protein